MVDLSALTPGGTSTASVTVNNTGPTEQAVWISFPDAEALLAAVNQGVATGSLTVSISVDGILVATTSTTQPAPGAVRVVDNLAAGESAEVGIEVAMSPDASADDIAVAALPFEISLAGSDSTPGT